MATNNNIEIKKRFKRFKDISLSFEPNPLSGDLTTLSDDRAISNAIKNIVLFTVGEVPFNNSIGSYISGYMFEDYGPAMTMLLKQEIERSIKRSEPRVEVTNIFVQQQEFEEQLFVQVEYKIIGYDELYSVKTLLQATR